MQLKLAEKKEQPVIVEKTLKDLKPGEYVKLKARVVRARIRESRDELGYRPKITGILEDSTSRVFFACYNPRLSLLPGMVVEIEGALVRELNNKNKILLIGENSKVYSLEEKLDKYIFYARVGDLDEPVSGIILSGKIMKIFKVLVKRCKVCNRVLLEKKCPDGHSEGFYYDLRMSFVLKDDTGAIKCIAPRELTAQLLKIPMSTAYDLIYEGDSQGFSIILKRKSSLRVKYFRSDGKIEGYFYDEAKGVAVLDGDSDPDNLEFIGFENVEDNVVGNAFLADLLQVYLDRVLPRKFLGFYMVKKYDTSFNGACLYMGFSLDIDVDKDLRLNIYPVVKAYQSVIDYIRYRRRKGASFKALKNSMLKYRNLVYLAPNGYVGKIVDVLPVKAGDYIIEGKNISLSSYWRSKGLEVGDEEKPVIKVKMYEFGGIELVYPPSKVYYEVSNLNRESPAYKYLVSKARKESLQLIRKAIEKLDVFKIEIVDRASGEPALEKLASRIIGKNVSLEGDVLKHGDRLFFLARRLVEYD